jgi:hypothetical protein
MSSEEIVEVRGRDDRDRIRHYGAKPAPVQEPAPLEPTPIAAEAPRGFWAWLKGLFR